MIEIRRAAVADADALAELRWEFRAGRQPPTEPHDAFVERCAAWMRRELSAPAAWQAWVAVDDRVDRRAGVAAHRREDSEPGRRAPSITPTCRISTSGRPHRGGIGTRLLEAALDWRRADRVDRVVLWPSGRSVTLYLRHGFSHGGDVMELKIDEADDRALHVGVDRGLRRRILPRQLERVVALRDDVQRRRRLQRRRGSARARPACRTRRACPGRTASAARSPADACRGARSGRPGGCSG